MAIMLNFISSFFVHIYSIIFNFLKVSGILSVIFHKKITKEQLKEHFTIPNLKYDVSDFEVIWLHASSLGEIKILQDFIKLLDKKYDNYHYLITAVTNTGVDKILEFDNDKICGVGYFPIDTISNMTKITDRFSVKKLWIMETEIWPSLLWVCKKKNINVGIVNARLEEKSFSMYKRFKLILSPLLRHINPVLVQNSIYAKRFEEIGVNKNCIKIVGNIKSRVSIKRPKLDKWKSVRRNLSIDDNDIVVTAGCIHAGEINDIKRSIDGCSDLGINLKWIIIPRHMRDVSEIKNVLGNSAKHFLDIKQNSKWDCCIIEKYGILEDMYSISDLAIVGGTFVDVGGHNVWEPAQFGIPVMWGPHTYKQQESCDKLIDAGVGFSVKTGEDLANMILKVLKTDAGKFVSSVIKFTELSDNKMDELIQALL